MSLQVNNNSYKTIRVVRELLIKKIILFSSIFILSIGFWITKFRINLDEKKEEKRFLESETKNNNLNSTKIKLNSTINNERISLESSSPLLPEEEQNLKSVSQEDLEIGEQENLNNSTDSDTEDLSENNTHEETNSNLKYKYLFTEDFTEDQFFDLPLNDRPLSLKHFEHKLKNAQSVLDQLEQDKASGFFVNQQDIDYLRQNLQKNNLKLQFLKETSENKLMQNSGQ